MWGLAVYNNAVRPVICEGWQFIITLFAQLYAGLDFYSHVCTMCVCGMHVHDRIIALRGKVWARLWHKPCVYFSLKVHKWEIVSKLRSSSSISNLSRFKHYYLGILVPEKRLKYFIFQLYWLPVWVYQTKLIPEICHVHLIRCIRLPLDCFSVDIN